MGRPLVCSAERGLALTRDLIQAASLLESAGISVLGFKGPALGLLVNGDVSSRQFCDVDILVSADLAQFSAQILTAAGYRGPALPTGRVFWRAFRAVSNHVRLFHKETGGLLELHWDLSPPELAASFRFEDLWQRSVPVQVGGTELRTLGLEDLTLYLCFHGWKHQWERVSWVQDIAALILRCKVEWDVVLTRARSMGLLRIVLSSLLLANELYDAPIPAPCRVALEKHSAVTRLAAELKTRGAPARPLRRFDPLVLRSRERWRDKLRYLLHPIFVPTPADVAALPLPEALFGAYYLIRPVRLAFRYALLGTRTLLRRLGLRLASAVV